MKMTGGPASMNIKLALIIIGATRMMESNSADSSIFRENFIIFLAKPLKSLLNYKRRREFI